MMRRLSTPIALALLLTGCRFYGSTETVDTAKIQIDEALAWSTSESTYLASDLSALAGHPEAASAVSELAERLAHTTEGWAQLGAGLAESRSHRDVRRALSAMISERQRHEDAYARIVRSLGGGADARAPRYQLEPGFYQRIHFRADHGRIRDVLQGG